METLESYVYINNLVNHIKACFEQHLILEYDLLCMCSNYDTFINENNGTFKDQIKLSKSICKLIEQSKNKNELVFDKNDFKDINNIFFDKLKIHLNYKLANDNSAYKNTSVIDKTTKNFKEVILLISYKNSSNLSLFKTISHELLHAWQDYQMKIKGLSIYDITSTDEYKKTSNTNKIGERIVYLIKRLELNAYLSEIVSEFKEYCKIKNVKSYKDAINYINKKSILLEYILFKQVLESDDINFIKEIANDYNNVSKTNLSYTQVKERLLSKITHYLDKIYNKLSVAYFEYIEEQNYDEHLMGIPKNAGYLRWLLEVKTGYGE